MVDELVIVDPVSVLSPPLNVTAPEYVCVPEVDTSAPMLEVPEMLKFVTFVIAPPIDALPVMVRAIAPPSKVDELVTVVPVNVLVPEPLTVTAPEYVCVPVVVTLAPMVEVPETLKFVTLVIAPPIDALPVMVSAIAPPFKVDELVTVVPVNVLVPVPLTVIAPV